MRTMVLLVALLAACGGTYGSGDVGGGGGDQGAADAGDAVTINWTLAAQASPVVTTVRAGTPVRWHSGDGITHTVQPDTTPPPNAIASIGPSGTSATQTIATPGTYHYHCAIHPGMHGTLVVQ